MTSLYWIKLTHIRLSIVEMRWYFNCAISIMGIHILIEQYLYIESCLGHHFNMKTIFASVGIPKIKIGSSHNHLNNGNSYQCSNSRPVPWSETDKFPGGLATLSFLSCYVYACLNITAAPSPATFPVWTLNPILVKQHLSCWMGSSMLNHFP